MSDDLQRADPEDTGFAEADADLIEDPEALRRAEEAVAEMDEPTTPWVPTDAEWVPVASAPSSAAWSLEELRGVLEAEGIPAGYDPYDPREAISLPYGMTSVFRVIVPAERLRGALRIVSELSAEGAAWAPVRTEPRP
jgi:hypothetical protein